MYKRVTKVIDDLNNGVKELKDDEQMSHLKLLAKTLVPLAKLKD